MGSPADPHGGPDRADTTPRERVLVTDLDGTLLAGDEDSRSRLRHALDRHPDITVVYATGRSLSSVRTMLAEEPLAPWPRWIIADVGASIIDTTDMSHSESLERPLRTGWPGRRRVRRALRRFPQLVPQDAVVQEGRCSYYLAAEHLSDEITTAVEELGCSWTYSADLYFDVLPACAGKGPALRELMRRLHWPRAHLLVAGDSLNDLSLFRLGTHGVVVGNAEPALVAQVAAEPLVHHPELDGAAAVLHALERLGWVERPKRVVIGYHRPPWQRYEGRWRQPASPNGILPTLVSALGAGADGRLDAVWAAATTEDASTAATVPPGLPLALLPLPAGQWAGYFHRACKETLWPALVSQAHLIRHDPADWADYEAVNAAFTQHVSAHAEYGATVWLHDYNLWLVPGLLKQCRPDLTVGLFHHTPFPDPRTFRRLAAAEQLCASLAQLDWAGFHTAAFAGNFRSLLAGAARMPRIGVHPLGIDRQAVASLARSRPAAATGRDGTVILSVERLDYAKAPVQKIHALAELLDRQPALRGRVHYRLVCPPPEQGIRAYDTTRTELERAITQINGLWRKGGWEPVEYIPRTLPFEEVVDHYLAADVFWVASLADGMNLTAQEYLTAQAATGRSGVLVLSRHAGAAAYVKGHALLTDPHSAHDLVEKLRTALAMTPAQRQAHTARLAGLLSTPTPAEWARTIIAAIGDAGAARAGSGATGRPRRPLPKTGCSRSGLRACRR
ncbi:trehalose-6-phosphate synthase [Streptomyces sp. NPDC050448]|uniref:trehalose-6-phosphate synthase n=1 Tax=Streptomyces sp. NPDC050448 TaxID=3155404 RepID=UPI0034208E1F